MASTRCFKIKVQEFFSKFYVHTIISITFRQQFMRKDRVYSCNEMCLKHSKKYEQSQFSQSATWQAEFNTWSNQESLIVFWAWFVTFSTIILKNCHEVLTYDSDVRHLSSHCFNLILKLITCIQHQYLTYLINS